MNSRRWIVLLVAASLISACAPAAAPTAAPLPTVAAPVIEMPTAAPPQPTMTLIPLPTSALGVPSASAPLVLPPVPGVCSPQVTASTIVNVREGPGTMYAILGSLSAGETAKIDGKNADATWWNIAFPAAVSGKGWVSAGVTTTSCLTEVIPIIDTSSLPVYAAAITNVVVGISPSEENVPGCLPGESHRFTASATISASGPMQVTYVWEIEGVGSTNAQSLTFSGYESKSVSTTFKPEVVEGRHMVRLWIEGLDMRTWEYQTSYRITC